MQSLETRLNAITRTAVRLGRLSIFNTLEDIPPKKVIAEINFDILFHSLE